MLTPDLSAIGLQQFVLARIGALAGRMHVEAFERRGERIPPGKPIPPAYRRKAGEQIAGIVCRDARISRDAYASTLAGEADDETRASVWAALGVEVGE